MAIFNQSSSNKSAPAPAPAEPVREPAPAANTDFAPATLPRSSAAAEPARKESLIAADLTIEGKIEGNGHIRIAGRFKGDVNVQGDLSVERGAKLNGSVRAQKVTVAGELEGNVESAVRVELLEAAALVGDLKAGTLTVASGAKIRGHVDCGWEGAGKPGKAEPSGEA